MSTCEYVCVYLSLCACMHSLINLLCPFWCQYTVQSLPPFCSVVAAGVVLFLF